MVSGLAEMGIKIPLHTKSMFFTRPFALCSDAASEWAMAGKFTRESKPDIQTAAPFVCPNHAMGGICTPCPNFVRNYYCRCPYAHLAMLDRLDIIPRLLYEISDAKVNVFLEFSNRKTGARPKTDTGFQIIKWGDSASAGRQIKYSIVFSSVSLVVSLNSSTASRVSIGPSA